MATRAGWGNRDPLHQQRVAIAEWERGLRPKVNRHWALWLVRAALLVFVAYRAGEWLLAQRGASPPAEHKAGQIHA